MPKDQIMLESVSDKGKLILCTSNVVSSRCAAYILMELNNH